MAAPDATRSAFAAHFSDVEANQHLTTLVGLLLLPLVGVEMFTALSLRLMIAPHILVGLWLVPVVAVKMASTGYRFAKYYTRNPEYFRAGPPAWVPRLLAPVIVLSTVGLFGSGIMLWALGPAGKDPWSAIHKLSFVLWASSTGIHVLIHLRETLTTGFSQLARRAPGPALRRRLAVGAVAVGLVIGVAGLVAGPAWPPGSIGDHDRGDGERGDAG